MTLGPWFLFSVIFSLDVNTQALKSGYVAKRRPPRKKWDPKTYNPYVNTTHRSSWRGLRFVRIQKTASTSFGEDIVPLFCRPKKLCSGKGHKDYDDATRYWRGPVVTFLREPVERTLSEFFFMRTKDGKLYSSTGDWDFRNDTWLKYVQEHPDTDSALQVYLHGYPRSPSRNRQALYLLGFRANMTHPADVSVEPGAVYNWDRDHGTLLERAKAHLDNLTAFGLSDCFMASMRVIARRLDWPEEEVVRVSEDMHSRKLDKDKERSLQQQRHLQLLAGSFLDRDDVEPRWRDRVPPEVVADIEHLNAVDMDLYAYARARFATVVGDACR